MHRAQNVPKGDFRRRAREQIAAILPSHTAGDSLGFEFDEDLNQVIGWDTLLGCEVFDADCFPARMVTRQTQHSPGGIITLDGELHCPSLGRFFLNRN
jgi:hypothetical protein